MDHRSIKEKDNNHMSDEAEEFPPGKLVEHIEDILEEHGGYIAYEDVHLQITGAVGVTEEAREEVITNLNSVYIALYSAEPDISPQLASFLKLLEEYSRFFSRPISIINQVN